MFRKQQRPTEPTGLVIGRRFDTRPLVLPWPNMGHALVSGLTGSGKSVSCHNILGQLAGYPDVAIMAFDRKRTDMTKWAPRLTLLATTAKEADDGLSDLRGLIDTRTRLLAEFGELNWHPRFGPWVVALIDEYAELAAIDTDGIDHEAETKVLDALLRRARATRQIRLANVSSIARLGRAVGITLIVATQYPTAEVIDQQVRTQLDIRLMHRVASDEQVNVCLGQGRSATISAKSIPSTQPGGLWLVGTPDTPEPIRGRSNRVTVDDIRQRAAATAHLAWPYDTVFGSEAIAEEAY